MIAQESASFAVGPLSAVLPAGEFESWLWSAMAGTKVAYASGAVLPRGAAAVALAGEWARAGLVDLVSEKVPGTGWVWWAVRREGGRGARGPAGGGLNSACPSTTLRHAQDGPPPRDWEDQEDAADLDGPVMRLIRRCANFGMPAPTLRDIAAAGELSGSSAAARLLARFENYGWVRVQNDGGGLRRMIILDAKGKPVKATAWLNMRGGGA